MYSSHGDRKPVVRRVAAGAILLGLSMVATVNMDCVHGEPVDGYTEPYRTFDVAAPEPGILVDILVKEGETVERGQVVAMLDIDVLEAELAIADRAARSFGSLNSARAEHRLRNERFEQLSELHVKGVARKEEVDRAAADLEIAKAQLASAQDQLAIRKLEHAKIKAQIARRIIRAPDDGVVSAIFKDEGEQVSTTDPHVLTIVQLDPLSAVFSLQTGQAHRLRIGQGVVVNPLELRPNGEISNASVTGTVEFVAPVTQAESGTVLVKVRLSNDEGSYRSGERCWMELGEQVQSAANY